MLEIFLWCLIASLSLVVGGVVGLVIPLGRRALGSIMAFGAGTLLSAVAFELVLEAVQLSAGSGATGLGFFLGAATFFILDRFVESLSPDEGKGAATLHQSTLVVPLILATVLDGIPESLVIGLSFIGGGQVSVAIMAAVFLSNLPESIAGTIGMKASGWGVGKILALWLIVAIACAVAGAAGYQLLADASVLWVSFINAFAAGAILMMLTNTMVPGAYERAGKLAGIFTSLGFAVSVAIVVLERT